MLQFFKIAINFDILNFNIILDMDDQQQKKRLPFNGIASSVIFI